MQRMPTFSLPDDLNQGLRANVGEEGMSQFVADAVRPLRSTEDLAREYAEAAADVEHEREALEWIEADLGGDLE
jgi:hypothetical protein